jgi:hypothetical protein
MAEILPFERRHSRCPSDGAGLPRWRLVSVRPEATGFAVEVWTGRPSLADSICALVGYRTTWADAMALAHDRARELSIIEVVDFGGAEQQGDPRPAA